MNSIAISKLKLQKHIAEIELIRLTLERIVYLRKKVLVHSYIYYVLNDNIIDDNTWSAWAEELEQLQRDNSSDNLFLSDVFKGFDHSTGANLEYPDWVYDKALQLIRYNYEKK